MKVIFVIIASIFLIIWYENIHKAHESNAQKYDTCILNAGKAYDSLKGKTTEERRSKIYAEDMQWCANIYPH